MKNAMLIIISLFFSTVVSAATWKVTGVESGVDGGFGYSGLHDASGQNVMSGDEFTKITGAKGTYNDETGAVDFMFTISNGTSFGLTGNLLFNGAGWLANHSTLNYTGLDIAGIATDGIFGFKKGDVCCNGEFDPNSFMESGNGDLNFLTLWGADGFHTWTNWWGKEKGYYWDSTVGMDFRLALAPVPLPAAVWLFGPALLGLLGIRRRKVSVTAA